jgi:hypothetical protein
MARKMNEHRAQYIVEQRKIQKKPRKLKCAVLREEYFELTSDPMTAIVLNQFVYWSERTDDYDKFISEENDRRSQEGQDVIPLTAGWIYKSSADMSDEIMMGSESSVRRCIVNLVERGLLSERSNPYHKWDRCLQYRVDLVKLSSDLAVLGYTIPNYSFAPTIPHGDASIPQADASIPHGDAALPETIIDNYSEIIPEVDASENQSNQPKEEYVPLDSIGEPKKKKRGENMKIAYALSDVCREPFEANRGKLLKAASDIMLCRPEPTPDLIRKEYGHGGWYWKNDWRGQKGQIPNLATIRSTWGQWIEPDKPKPNIATVEEVSERFRHRAEMQNLQ